MHYEDSVTQFNSTDAWRGNVVEMPIIDRGFQDINPVLFGEEQANRSSSFGYNMRDCFLMHYVISGCGVFQCPRGEYQVQAGQCFIIHPMERVLYAPDKDDPWRYIWLGVTGSVAQRLIALPDVVDIDEPQLFLSMRRCREFTADRELFLAARCADLFCRLFQYQQTRERSQYIQYAVHYIGEHYMEQISVEELANALHIDRHYLTKLFQSEFQTSTKEYITRVKMEKARRFLTAGATVSEAAGYVGYFDVLHFSKTYKKHYGEAPSVTRRNKA